MDDNTEIALENLQAANSNWRKDDDKDALIRQQNELLREALEHLSNPLFEPWMDARADIIDKIKTALGDV